MFKNFDPIIFKQKLADSYLEEICECTDVNQAAKLLVSKMCDVLDQIAPVRTIQTKSRYAPWLSPK